MRSEYVETSRLCIEVEIGGPADGRPVVMLHGWPDDAHTWDGVVGRLHEAGFRTIAPYLRGFGGTRFLSAATPRTGQLSALGQDVLDLADVLHLERFAVVGHDWGARAAYIAACIAGPNRVAHCVALSVAWPTSDPDQALSLLQVQNYWYQWYMALGRGAELVRNERREFTRYIWTEWNPGWRITEHDFARTAASFDNHDWAEVVLHSYRSRWGLSPLDESYADIDARLAADPNIEVPTLVLHGGADPCNAPALSDHSESYFAAHYRRVVLDGVGHFPQRQQPTVVSEEIVRHLTAT